MPSTLPAFTFGTELELYLPVGVTHQEAARRITEAGVACNSEHYNHNTPRAWKIVTDGSLGDYVRGAEIVSPILSGEDGLTQLSTVCQTLTAMGAEIRRSCGLHVHVGIAREDSQTVRNLYTLYGHFEPVIDQFMPRSRRSGANGYCQPVRGRVTAVSRAPDMQSIRAAMPGRYWTVNFDSFFRYGTVEFRQHSGTVDAQKATSWVRLLLGLVEAAKNLTPAAPAQVGGWVNPFPVGSVNNALIARLVEPRGITSGEAAAIVGRTTGFNLTAIARAAGLSIRLRRSGNWRNNRYTVVAGGPSASTAAPVAVAPASLPSASLEALLTLTNATPAVRSYFIERTEALAA